MARPPLALGHHGSVTTTRENGRWVARCRVRDLDGRTRKVERWGTAKAGAQAALQDELRNRHGERVEALRPHSRFRWESPRARRVPRPDPAGGPGPSRTGLRPDPPRTRQRA